MPRRRFSFRFRWFALLIVLSVVTATGFLVWRVAGEARQQQKDRALIAAIKYQEGTQVVLSLLVNGANPNAEDKPADNRSLWQMVLDTLRMRRTSKQDYETALLLTINKPFIVHRLANAPPADILPVVKALVDRGARLEAKGEGGRTALYYAVLNDDEQAANYLLAKGANANQEGILHFNASPALFRLLIQHGADVNQTDTGGMTPLQAISEMGNVTLLRILLDAGAKINVKTEAYGTPLIFAARYNKVAAVKLLLARGADVSPTDRKGDTVFSGMDHYPVILKLLRQAKAKQQAKKTARKP